MNHESVHKAADEAGGLVRITTAATNWIKRLEANGFDVTTHDGGNSDARSRLKMPITFGSCHTGEAGGYAIERHVPAREIKRVLEERPDAIDWLCPRCREGRPAWTGPSTVAFVTHTTCF